MQMLHGCLCGTSQTHLLAKKFVITQNGIIMCLMASAVPINISTQRCKMTEPGMMNMYWTKIKLRAAANQAIYLVIFHKVVRSLYLNSYNVLLILLLDRCRIYKRGE